MLSIDGFIIMRSDESEKAITDASIKLKNAINEKISGSDISIGTDFVKRGDPVPTDTAEIIVGNTNRMTAEGLKRGDYEIKRDGNRIYILGGSSEAVSSAVDKFIETYICDSGLSIPDNTDLRVAGKYKIEKLTIGSSEINQLKVYKDNTAAEDVKIYCERLIPLLEDTTGLDATMVDSGDDANIIFSDSEKIPSGNWGYIANDGKLIIVGHDRVEALKAYKYLSSLLNNSGETLSLNGVHSEKQLTKEEFLTMEQLVIYPEFPEAIKRDYTYDVSVTQGNRTEKLPVYNHVMESTVSRGYDGTDNARRFSMFAFSGTEVRVDIKVKTDFSSYSVMPSAKNFRHEFKDGVISVYLDKPEYFLIRLDDSDNSILSVFADEPEFTDEYDFEDPNFIKIEGWVEPEGGMYELTEPNTTLYIAPGAVLNARVDVTGQGSKVIGHGAIVDPFENIYEYDIRVGGTEGHGKNLLNISGNNITLDGPILLDARCFNITMGGNDHVVRNMKVMSTMMTSDGLSVWWGSDILIEHCFVYCGDNVMVFSNENITYRDITGGTTCAVIFPQGHPIKTNITDIHAFRADDGFINHFYNGSREQLTADVSMKNLDSVDCAYMPWFFKGQDMGEADKKFTIENVSLGDVSAQNTENIFRFINYPEYYMVSDNYKMTFKNFAVNGKMLDSLDDINISVEGNPKYPGNEYSYSVDTFEPVVHDSTETNYKAPDKIFIGECQIFFEHQIIKDGGTFLPAEQLMGELYTEKCAPVIDIDGVKYVDLNDLVDSGMAANVSNRDDAVIITPNTPNELLTPDSGEISHFTESTCYELDLVTSKDDGDTVYTVYNTAKTLSSGIARVVTNEVRKFGAGKYRFSFKAKASENGSLNILVSYKKADTVVQTVKVGEKYTEYVFEFEVTEALLKEKTINLVVCGADKPLESFSIKDISLSKIG